MVSEVGGWEEREWKWSWKWRRQFFQWEEDMIFDLQQLLGVVPIPAGVKDWWVWKEDGSSQLNLFLVGNDN